MTLTLELSAEVQEYLGLMGKAMNLDVNGVVKQIIVSTFADNIKKNPAVRPAEIAKQIADLEQQANDIFQKAVAEA